MHAGEANRKVQAADGVMRQRMHELSAAIADAWPTWIEEQREAVSEATAEIAGLIDGLRAAFRRHSVEAELHEGLRRYAGVSRTPGFGGFGRPHADRAEARAIAKAEATERTNIESCLFLPGRWRRSGTLVTVPINGAPHQPDDKGRDCADGDYD